MIRVGDCSMQRKLLILIAAATAIATAASGCQSRLKLAEFNIGEGDGAPDAGWIVNVRQIYEVELQSGTEKTLQVSTGSKSTIAGISQQTRLRMDVKRLPFSDSKLTVVVGKGQVYKEVTSELKADVKGVVDAYNAERIEAAKRRKARLCVRDPSNDLCE